MSAQTELDFPAFLDLLKRRAWLIVGIGVAAAALAFGVSMLQSNRYDASADLLFRQAETPPRIDPNEPPPDVADAPERVAATNLALASLDSVAVRVKERTDSPLSSEELRDKVEIEPKGQADIVTVTASAETAQEAAKLANAFAEEVVAVRREKAQERIQRVIDAIDQQLATAPPAGGLAQRLTDRSQQLKIEKELEAGDAEVAEEAVPPRDKAAPKPVRNAVIGLVLGLILGTLVALLLSRLDRRVHDEDEVSEIVGAPVIGRIPVIKERGWEHQLYLESFQFLRANLQLRRDNAKHRTFAVTSTLPAEGKSTIVARLAEALALGGASVIVVDCDLRRPTLHTAFGLQNEQGVTTAILSGAVARDLLLDTPVERVRLLPAGPLTATPGSFLTGVHGIGELIGELAREADYVIVDTSPATIGADATAVAAEVDATLLVVDADAVEGKVLAATVDQLRNAEATIAGIVLNRAPVLLKDRAYQGYYGPKPIQGSDAEPSTPSVDALAPTSTGVKRVTRVEPGEGGNGKPAREREAQSGFKSGASPGDDG
jgi:capsular exopolysaccharide synthesis family protein